MNKEEVVTKISHAIADHFGIRDTELADSAFVLIHEMVSKLDTRNVTLRYTVLETGEEHTEFVRQVFVPSLELVDGGPSIPPNIGKEPEPDRSLGRAWRETNNFAAKCIGIGAH